VWHFKELFSEKEDESIEDMLHILRLFPKMIEEDDNRESFRDISKEELCGVLD